MKKRIISLILTICMLLPSVMVAVAEDTSVPSVSQEVQDAKDFMVRLGVVDADFDVTDIMTKSAFLCLALDVTKVTTVTADKEYFNDVPQNYYAVNEIATGYNAGYIKGNGNGTFSPDKIINVNEALAIVMNILNYGHLAGTPSYQRTINQQNLLKNVDIEADGTIKRGACLMLFKNMLLAEYNMLSGFEGEAGIYSTDETTTLLYVLYSIVSAEGIVTAVDDIYLNGYKKVKQGQMAVNNTIIDDKDGLANDLLGFNVEVFAVKDETGYTLFDISKKTRKNEEIVFEADDLTNKSTASKIVYLNESDKEKTINLPSKYTLIYNGRNYNGFGNNIFRINQGKVRLVSNDGGNEYTLVYVYEYENKIVKSVNARDEKIYIEGSTQPIDYSDKDDVILLDAQGEQMSGDDLYEGLVITTFKSKGTPAFYTIKAGLGERIFTPDGIDDEYLYMGENKVRMTADVLARRSEIMLGTKTILSLDAFGDVVDFETVVTDVMYGYLVDIEILDSSFGETTYGVKIFSENNEMVVYKTGEYLKYNNVRDESSDVIANFCDASGVCVPQLIRFSATDEGTLSGMWKYTDKSGVANYAGFDEDNFTLDYVTGSSFQYRASGVIDTKYVINGSTLRFIIPSNGNEKDYKCTTCASGLDEAVTSGITYSLFDAGKERVASVLLEVSSSSVSDFGGYKQPVVVKELSYSVNDEGLEVLVIKGYSNQTEVRYITEDVDLADNGEWCAAFAGIKATELQAGDVIQVNASGSSGEIYSMRILYRRSTPDAYNEAANRPYSGIDYYAYLYTTAATVTEQYSSSIIAHTNRTATAAGEAAMNRIMPLSGSVVYYVYDSQRDKLTITDKSEYMEGHNIFAALYLAAVKMIVIYK